MPCDRNIISCGGLLHTRSGSGDEWRETYWLGLGLLFVFNGVYGLSTGEIRYPGGRGGTGGVWLSRTDETTGFWVVVVVSVIVGLIMLRTDYEE